jgi:hypothetical protein
MTPTNELIRILIEPFERLLAEIFPPRIPRFRVKWTGGIEDDVQGDGILWRAYDVRADGIEKHAWEESLI